MCDIDKVSKDTKEFIREIDDTLNTSGAIVVQVEEDMKKLRKQVDDNMERLSFLL
tara:strand:+ start:1111 stop:1275 length:165 start_codon:yes stop_codon:yes gene_type:complete